MLDLDANTYREREKHWQREADRLPPGHDRDGCLALAKRYAHLTEIIERLHAPEAVPRHDKQSANA